MTARRRRPRRVAASVASAVLVVGCTSDPGVRTEQADVIGGSPTTVADTSAPPAPGPAAGPADPGPVFTLPALTLPEPASSSPGLDELDHAPSADSEPGATDGSTPATERPGAADLATAGDSLFPEVGNDGLDVGHYLVRIAYDPTVAVIDGEVTITATGLRSLEHIVLDAVGLDVSAVTVDGVDTTFDLTGDELVIGQPLAAGTEIEITVRYSAAPRTGTGAFGLDVGWFATPQGSYVLNEPNGTRYWMPADDHPGDKATWRFELTVPDGLAGIANGAQRAPVDAGPDTTWIWDQDEPMATYLVLLVTGDYEVIDGGEVGGIPLVHAALSDDVQRMRPYFDAVAPQLEFFETVFGAYPLDRYGLAFTESVPGLAMETQGRSMFSAADFPGASGPLGYFEELLLAHELAHQWFGNAVSPDDWGDLWLNESFATYGQWLWFDHVDQEPIDVSAQRALQARQAPGEPTGTPTVDNLFGLARYDGGAVVLHALRREIGDDAFFDVLTRWSADNDGTSRSTEDFIELAEAIAERPLTALFDAWLFSGVVPDAYPG